MGETPKESVESVEEPIPEPSIHVEAAPVIIGAAPVEAPVQPKGTLVMNLNTNVIHYRGFIIRPKQVKSLHFLSVLVVFRRKYSFLHLIQNRRALLAKVWEARKSV